MRHVSQCWAAIGLAWCASVAADNGTEALAAEVAQVERAFAATMAARDLAGFGDFVDEHAVFFNGADALRGRAAVMAAWSAYFDGESPPFSWAPDQVEVLPSGDLAFSSGPVLGSDGRAVARFNSVWRRSEDGRWQVVFDKGTPLPRAPSP